MMEVHCEGKLLGELQREETQYFGAALHVMEVLWEEKLLGELQKEEKQYFGAAPHVMEVCREGNLLAELRWEEKQYLRGRVHVMEVRYGQNLLGELRWEEKHELGQEGKFQGGSSYLLLFDSAILDIEVGDDLCVWVLLVHLFYAMGEGLQSVVCSSFY